MIITQFIEDYIKAQHRLEWSEFPGGASFEVILTALLVVVTGGVGAVASLGAQARKISQLKKLGELLSELAEALKRLPKPKKMTLRQLKEFEDKKNRKLLIFHDASSINNVKPAYVNTTKKLESYTDVNVEKESLNKNTKMNIEEKKLESFGGAIKILKNGNRVVIFSSCEITEETIEFLVKCIHVENLLFYYCDFKGINLSILNKSNISTLSSMHGNFNDEHLKQLEVISSLKTIKLHDTKVSKSAMNQFLLARPDVNLI